MFGMKRERKVYNQVSCNCSTNLEVPPIRYDAFESISEIFADPTMKPSKIFKDTILYLQAS